MKCPICNQEVQPSDHSEQWGPEFAHSRCIVAFNAGSAVQDAKLLDRIKRLEEAGDAMASILNNTRKDWYTSDQCEVTAFNWREAKEAKL